ncbi:hypothetical protein [Candidatus Venteria ishoeyi]|uniref:Uncharacterized protein n=1 Tax=Candidatus Venteria ishoeyi TaxID=1899563 RepID=A0A1H6FAU6_9GAMM|nr:hypothetical protein [Candidatus Venteria ishoeyi]SEH06125.1 Uncharacterised protein [Candidatus Venteria ishoeyi]
MQGINFIVNDQQEKVAVVIDLQNYAELWEDFYDSLLAKQRKDEPRESLADFKAQLIQQGKLDNV